MTEIDVIAQSGPEGDHLNKEHTRKHFREAWTPDLLDRTNHKAWQNAGGRPSASGLQSESRAS